MVVSAEQIIVALGDTGAVAEALGKPDSTVSSWKTRGIPGPHWAALAKRAAEIGRSDITLETLAKFAGVRAETAEART